VVTTKQRADPGKPMPEFARWKGARVLYCSEPTHDDVLHSGILKDMTGGEQIVYRLLFSNAISCYRPMHKLHMMCNDKPKVNGGDSGVVRRVRVVEYNSQFVDGDTPVRPRHRQDGEDGQRRGHAHGVLAVPPEGLRHAVGI
jgi:phage/plasmid-associated DNA primase